MSDLLGVRTIKPTDFEQYASLSSSAFGVPIEGERKLLDLVNPEQILIAELEGEIVAQLFIHRLGVWLNGKLLSLGGIGGVTTSHNHRQKGYATMLLQKTLEHLWDVLGCTMSALYPTTYSLYHRFGWTIADRGCMFTATPETFNLSGKDSDHRNEQRIIQPEDIPLLQAIRHHFAVTAQGFIERDELGWRLRILGQFSAKVPERLLVLHYDRRHKEDGYLIYEIKENNTVEVVEFIYNSSESFNGLLSFISENVLQSTVSIWLSTEAPLFSKVVNPLAFQVTCDPLRRVMFRIVDVAKALSGRPIVDSEIKGTFTLKIMDNMAKWNDGLWRIEIEKGNTQCKKSEIPTNPDVVLDIQTLTQLLVGYCSMNDVIVNGCIQVNRPEALALLKTFFESKSSPFSGEHF